MRAYQRFMRGPFFRHGSMAAAETRATYLNVFEHFQPSVPEGLQAPAVLFCANLHPEIQRSVIDQTEAKRLSMLDSMNLWITIAKPSLLEVMGAVDLVINRHGLPACFDVLRGNRVGRRRKHPPVGPRRVGPATVVRPTGMPARAMSCRVIASFLFG